MMLELPFGVNKEMFSQLKDKVSLGKSNLNYRLSEQNCPSKLRIIKSNFNKGRLREKSQTRQSASQH